jgi:hypothetical protein
MNRFLLPTLAAGLVLTASGAAAQAIRLVCPQPAAYDRLSAENAYDDQVNTAATVRTETAMSDGEAYWRRVHSAPPAVNYDVIYGPGAFAQAFEGPRIPIW